MNVKLLMSCPGSTVLVDAPLNTLTAAACELPAPSVKVGLLPVADNVGASFTEVILIVPEILEVNAPPVPVLPPSFKVTVSARDGLAPPAVGSSDKLL